MLGGLFSPALTVLCREAVLSTIPEPRAAPASPPLLDRWPMTGLHAGWRWGMGLQTGLPPLGLETLVQPPPCPGLPAVALLPLPPPGSCSRPQAQTPFSLGLAVKATGSPGPKVLSCVCVSSGSLLTADRWWPPTHVTTFSFLSGLAFEGVSCRGLPSIPPGLFLPPSFPESPSLPAQSAQRPHCLSLSLCSCPLGHSL